MRIKLKIEPGWDVEPVRAVRERFGDDAAAAGRRQHRLHARRRRSAGAARPVRPAAHRAAAARGRHARPRRPRQADRDAGVPRRVDRVGAATRPPRSGSAPRPIINIKPGRVGGYLEAKRIHDVCVAHGVPVWCGGMLETGIGRAANVALASLPGFTLPGDTSAVRPLLPPRPHRRRSSWSTASSRCRPGRARRRPDADILDEFTTSTEWLTDLTWVANGSRLVQRSGYRQPEPAPARQPRAGPRRPGRAPCSTSCTATSTRAGDIGGVVIHDPLDEPGAAAARAGARRRGRGPRRRSSRCCDELGREGAAALVLRAPVALTTTCARPPTRPAWPCSASPAARRGPARRDAALAARRGRRRRGRAGVARRAAVGRPVRGGQRHRGAAGRARSRSRTAAPGCWPSPGGRTRPTPRASRPSSAGRCPSATRASSPSAACSASSTAATGRCSSTRPRRDGLTDAPRRDRGPRRRRGARLDLGGRAGPLTAERHRGPAATPRSSSRCTCCGSGRAPTSAPAARRPRSAPRSRAAPAPARRSSGSASPASR